MDVLSRKVFLNASCGRAFHQGSDMQVTPFMDSRDRTPGLVNACGEQRARRAATKRCNDRPVFSGTGSPPDAIPDVLNYAAFIARSPVQSREFDEAGSQSGTGAQDPRAKESSHPSRLRRPCDHSKRLRPRGFGGHSVMGSWDAVRTDPGRLGVDNQAEASSNAASSSLRA